MAKRNRHTWPTETKEAVITAIGDEVLTIRAAEKAYGVPRSTISSWLHGVGISDVTTKNGTKKGSVLIERLYAVREKYLQRMDDCAETARLGNAITAFGVITDKIQLLGGKSTEIHGALKLKWPHELRKEQRNGNGSAT